MPERRAGTELMMKKGRKNTGCTKQLSHSQNFITDRKLLRRIVRLGSIGKEDTIFEIGTGKGHLTEALCQKGGFVYSIEIDAKLAEYAKTKLSQFTNLKLIYGDFLKTSLPQKGDYKVFANIPYSITTQIIEKLTNAINQPTDIWLIMEKGAAKRFMGVPRETGKSLLLKVNWEMEILWYFRREDFHPRPSVDSVLLHFSRKAVPDLDKKMYYAFEKFIKHSLQYGICGKKGLLTKRQVQVALRQAGLPHAHEDGVTLYIQWLCLFRYYQRCQSRSF